MISLDRDVGGADDSQFINVGSSTCVIPIFAISVLDKIKDVME